MNGRASSSSALYVQPTLDDFNELAYITCDIDREVLLKCIRAHNALYAKVNSELINSHPGLGSWLKMDTPTLLARLDEKMIPIATKCTQNAMLALAKVREAEARFASNTSNEVEDLIESCLAIRSYEINLVSWHVVAKFSLRHLKFVTDILKQRTQ